MLHFVLNINREVAISNLLVFFSEKGLTAELVPYVSEGRKLPVPSHTFCLGACDIMMSLESQKLVLTPWTQSSDENTYNQYVFLRFF